MPDLDIVGTAAVDVVPIAPNFHTKLKAIVLPSADRVGEEAGRRMGDAISRHIVIALPDAITTGGAAATRAAGRQGDNAGGAFARSLRRKLEVAFKAMPKLDIRLSDTGVDAELARLRARMEVLSNKRIGIDIDAATAEAEVVKIDAELKRLGANHPNIAVRADTAAARAALAEFRAEIAAVDERKRIKIDLDTSAAQGALLRLSIALGSVLAIPLFPIAAAGIGAIASAAVAATAGVGAFALAAIPAIKGVTAAIQAKTAADKEAANASDNSAAAGVRAAQHALQMAGAQQALTAAHRNAASSIEQANRAVANAERSLSDAKRNARQAEMDLTQARKDATQQLRDLQDQMLDGVLDEREATLRVKEAREELARVLADPTATDLQRERAQLSVDEALRNADKQKTKNKELKQTVTDATKAGVNGNDQVKAAADRVADANRKVVDQTQAVADAQVKAREAQVQAAEAIETAERGVESARLSSIDTTAKSKTKADEYREALAKLTPEQRDLYDSIAGPKGLTKAFKEWSTSLQPDVLPIFTRFVDGAKNSLPTLTPLVEAAADAIGNLQDRASDDLKEPFWQRFKVDIQESAQPAIEGLGIAFGNVLKGMAGIVDAFLPHMDGISATMERITKRFANWGTGLKGSPEFENFLAYVNDMAPKFAEFLGDIFGAVFDIAHALSPMTTVAMAVLTPLIDGIRWIATNVPGAIQILWGIYVVNKTIQLGMVAFAAAMGLYEIAVAGATLVTSGWAAALSATGIVPLIKALVIIVAALVIGIIWAYKNVGWFRDAVDASWAGIKAATDWLWNEGIKPAFNGIVAGLTWLGDAAVWLWQEAILPAFNGIVFAAKLLIAIVLTVLITPLVLAFHILAAIALWLWTDGIKPTFQGIADMAMWLWTFVLQPVFVFIWDIIKWVGDQFLWLYDHAVSPSLGWIADKANWLWTKMLQPALKFIWDGLKWLGDKFVWLYDHAVKPSFDWISDKTNWLNTKVLNPAFETMKSAVALVGDAFEDAKDAIGVAWSQVSDIAKKPVNFIIEWVYTKGIKAVWDRVAEFVGLGKLPKAPKLLAEGGRTSGGIPGKDSIPALLMADEFVIKRDSARQIGFDNLAYMNSTGEIPRFAKGGLVGGVWDWTKDTVSDVVGTGIDWASTGADLLTDPSKVFTKLMSPILNKVSDGVGSAPMGKALAKFPGRMVDGLKDMIVGAADTLFMGRGGNGQWAKPVSAAYGTRFGVAGSMWSSGHHTGLDFPAPTGTPVRSVDAGTVIGVGHGGPYGNNIEVSHGGGLTSLYAHLSKIIVGLNEKVGRSEHIGNVGATGNVTGPHLHLEARQNGRSIDPMPFLTGGGGGFSARAVGSAQQYAKGILSSYGWGPEQFGPLQKLWNGESGWRWNAKNPSSGAYGIPQSLPASKMASAGSDWLTNPETQIRWGLGYIKSRPDYGSPAAAYSKWLSRSPHWYDEGGYLPPGLSLVANGTGSPEPVFTGTQWADIRAAKSGGGPTTINANVRVFVGDREITDIVRTEIDTYDSQLATDLNNGRWT